MIDAIREVAQHYLDTGITKDGFSVLAMGEKPVSIVKSVGSLEISDKDGVAFTVEYEALVPIHGSGVDDIYTVRSVTQNST